MSNKAKNNPGSPRRQRGKKKKRNHFDFKPHSGAAAAVGNDDVDDDGTVTIFVPLVYGELSTGQTIFDGDPLVAVKAPGDQLTASGDIDQLIIDVLDNISRYQQTKASQHGVEIDKSRPTHNDLLVCTRRPPVSADRDCRQTLAPYIKLISPTSAFHVMKRLSFTSGLTSLDWKLFYLLDGADDSEPVAYDPALLSNRRPSALLLLPERRIPRPLQLNRFPSNKRQLLKSAKITSNGRKFLYFFGQFISAVLAVVAIANPEDVVRLSLLYRMVLLFFLVFITSMIVVQSEMNVAGTLRFGAVSGDEQLLYDSCLLTSPSSTSSDSSGVRVAEFSCDLRKERRKAVWTMVLGIVLLLACVGLTAGLSPQIHREWNQIDSKLDQDERDQERLKFYSDTFLLAVMTLGLVIMGAGSVFVARHNWKLLPAIVQSPAAPSPATRRTSSLLEREAARMAAALDDSWYGLYMLFVYLEGQAAEKGISTLEKWRPITHHRFRKASHFQARLYVFQQTAYHQKLKLV